MKVVISGYYGFDNAGDELILESIIRELRTRNKHVDITVLSIAPERTAQAHHVKSVSRWNPAKVLAVLRKADVLISGGGGLFQDDTGSASLYYYLAVILLARLLKKKVFLWAVGVNDLRRHNRLITARVLSLAHAITVREKDSFELLKEWGCPIKKIEVVADPVLLKDVSVVRLQDEKPRIAFILRPPRHARGTAEIFAKLADALHQRLNAQITFVPFHIEQDLRYSLSVMEAMKTPARMVQWNTLAELGDAMRKTDLVISQRLHGLILAALHGVPLIGVSDDPKIDRFLKELGQKNITRSSDLNHYALLALVLDIWEWREDFRKNAAFVLPTFKLRARRITDLFFPDKSAS